MLITCTLSMICIASLHISDNYYMYFPHLHTFSQSELTAKRNSVDVYRTYVRDLLAENVAMIGSIVDMENTTVREKVVQLF